MSFLRFFAIIVVFGAASLAWMVLGGSVWARTEMLDSRLSKEMQSLWGPKVLTQVAPYWNASANKNRMEEGSAGPSASRITADIRHDYRYKGLLWYSTFTVDFDAEYTIPAAASGNEPGGYFYFDLPGMVNGYDDLSVTVNGAAREVGQHEIVSKRITLALDRTSQTKIRIRYTTNGQDVWAYSPGVWSEITRRSDDTYGIGGCGGGQLARLSDFQLKVTTNFSDIDYPRGSRSPSKPAAPHDGGLAAQWEFKEALTNQPMGIVMPMRTNAGPIVYRMSFFAPVSLFFFFTVVFAVVVLKKIKLHPMHYLFIAGGFFAFHILLAYLADMIPIQAAFWLCAAVSVVLVVSYMRLVAGVKFAVFYAGLAQLVSLVGFSYAFFWRGKTGLAVIIGAVATLFVLMQATGRLNWFEVFKRREANSALPSSPGGPLNRSQYPNA